MDRRLLQAAISGDAAELNDLAVREPGVLLGTTPQGNNCLHIAAIHGHEGFCNHVLVLELQQSPALLTGINEDGETPLLTAVSRGRDSLASVLLRFCRDRQLKEIILKQDNRGCNVLHHAIRRGHRMLAIQLIEAEHALSKAANRRDESPMFIAAMRNFEDVLDKLLELPDSADSGALGFNALHAAVRNGNKVIAERVIKTRPSLARQETENKYTPIHLAAYEDKIDVLTVLLNHDPSLGYLISTAGKPLLCIAASEGHVGIAQELLKHCPDAPYCDANGSTCLHEAVLSGQPEFVEFVLESQELQHLINLADNNGETALHLAARNDETKMMVDAFLLHQDIDVTVLDSVGNDAMASISVSDDTTSTTSSEGAAAMDRRLLKAATTGDTIAMQRLISHEQAVLLGTTPQGNTCLHIASIHGHEGFCNDVLALNQSLPLLNAINADGETPLLTAVANGRAILASVLLRFCSDQQLSETILKQDNRGFNALHHAILRGHRKLALELIEAEPDLSKAVNKCYASPMFIAVMRGYADVLKKLLEIPDAAHGGAHGSNALHAAVKNGNNAVIAKRVIDARPWLVRQEDEHKRTPIHLAAVKDNTDVLKVFLEHDPSLGYFISTDGSPLLCIAATEGNVGVARELLRHCPDPPYYDASGSTCLHIALSSGQEDFVRFVVRSSQLQHLINRLNHRGKTALQLANRKMKEAKGKERKNIMRMVAVLEFHINNLIVHAEPVTSVMEMGQLFEAAACGHVAEMRRLYLDNPGVLDATTPQGNTCLHLAAIHGRNEFCRVAQALNPSLLATVNSDGETPLLAAVVRGNVSVASVLLSCCTGQQLSETILLQQDKRGCNALHHAIRNRHWKLALDLIDAEPAMSRAVDQYDESPMYIAVMRNYEDVFEKLLLIPDSAHEGSDGQNALHAAVRNGNSAIAKRIMETRPSLATEQTKADGNTPMQLAVLRNKIDVLRVLLVHDRSLGYVARNNDDGTPLLVAAAFRDQVDVARELLKHCPDAPFSTTEGWTCLHQAVWEGRVKFLDFVLHSPQLRGLVNMRDKDGDTALHLAVKKCNPKMVAALLLHPDIDVTVTNNDGSDAIWKLEYGTNHSKTLNWNEISMLMLDVDPQAETHIYNLRRAAQDNLTEAARENIKSLTKTYTGNTSLVAILIATITFAAAFTLPGGYSTDPGTEGLPIMAREFAFQAFLISDTVAMCSSLAVAFICVIAKWEDLEFLLHCRYFSKKLMWFAYIATTTAFATGLYTVLAPRLLWLAVLVCVLTTLLPILTYLLGKWPILGLRFYLGRTYKSELLDML